MPKSKKSRLVIHKMEQGTYMIERSPKVTCDVDEAVPCMD